MPGLLLFIFFLTINKFYNFYLCNLFSIKKRKLKEIEKQKSDAKVEIKPSAVKAAAAAAAAAAAEAAKPKCKIEKLFVPKVSVTWLSPAEIMSKVHPNSYSWHCN